jgi:16S rRNA (guanine527-N7)-methyltransferase
VAGRDLPARIARRAAKAAVVLAPGLADSLNAYLALLARWNKKISLSAFELEPPSDDAIDRLIIEPLAAARHVLPADRLLMDVGSGGGSPALPLKLAVPALRCVLIEAKVRKAAFLREAVRHLNLADVHVENQRVEDLFRRDDLRSAADIVTVRAVRADPEFFGALKGFLKPDGRVFAFVARELDRHVAGSAVRMELLVPSLQSRLAIVQLDRE